MVAPKNTLKAGGATPEGSARRARSPAEVSRPGGSEPSGTLPPIRFRCPVPPSKKNKRKMRRTAKGWSQAPSDAAMRLQKSLHHRLFVEFGRRGAHFQDRCVKVHLTHHVRASEIEVVVEDLGPRPKGLTGRKRDLANLLDVPLDAMEGAVYLNDNQVDAIDARRVL